MEGIKKDWSLKEYNTFGIDVFAKYFTVVENLEVLIECLEWVDDSKLDIFILGGGSNILLTNKLDKLVLKNDIKGKTILFENHDFVELRIGAGEVWHNVVLYCVEQGWGGIENLSLIPGSIGAAPIQNIGAYGVELKDVFISLEALNLQTKKIETFEKSQCDFGYRTSIFKTSHKDQYVITSVTLKLMKKPKLNTEYGIINDVLLDKGITDPSIKDVSNAVIDIRSSKLPDPKKLGNSGSFFKNPVVSKSVYDSLSLEYNIPGYVVNADEVKIPAGWLIEHAGWKGKRVGDVGVHVNQALVLVNYGGGSGEDILDLSTRIQISVKEKFGIEIEPEVNLV